MKIPVMQVVEGEFCELFDVDYIFVGINWSPQLWLSDADKSQ